MSVGYSPITSEYSIFVKISGKRKCFSINQTTTLPDLMNRIRKVHPNLDLRQCYLTCGGQPFNENTKGTLFQNMITANATLELVTRVLGGSNSIKKFGDVHITWEPCSIYGTDDLSSNRWKIKCSCAFSIEAIDSYITNYIKGNDIELKCPMCYTKWNYLSIRHILSYIKNRLQLKKLDNDITEKRINMNVNLKRCPNCQTLCERLDVKMLRVKCLLCESDDFCWECGSEWQSNSKYCSSPICKTICGSLQILDTCSVKNIDQNLNVPSIRACPNCKCLIEHMDKCKHMACTNCKREFCHVCLALKGETWPCGNYSSKCPVAPRQKL